MREAIRTGSWLTEERIRSYALMFGVMGVLALGINWRTGTTPLTDRLGKPIGTGTGVPIGVPVTITFFTFLVHRALSAVSFKIPRIRSVARG